MASRIGLYDESTGWKMIAFARLVREVTVEVPAMSRLTFLIFLLGTTGFGAHWGFDRNLYPGDAALPKLRQHFSFAGYWLNAPPGTAASSWLGKRTALRKQGFGFLLLFNGRLDKELKAASSAEQLGGADGDAAAKLAKAEGFPKNAIIFLDQEEGGRLLPEQLRYISAWSDAVLRLGYQAGVYCSGIPVREADGKTITTADDLKARSSNHSLHYFVYNDACPPSPGCQMAIRGQLNPTGSGIAFAEVWQVAQSPRRHDLTSRCAATYSKQDTCLAPESLIDIDLSLANSPDPSRGRQ